MLTGASNSATSSSAGMLGTLHRNEAQRAGDAAAQALATKNDAEWFAVHPRRGWRLRAVGLREYTDARVQYVLVQRGAIARHAQTPLAATALLARDCPLLDDHPHVDFVLAVLAHALEHAVAGDVIRLGELLDRVPVADVARALAASPCSRSNPVHKSARQ